MIAEGSLYLTDGGIETTLIFLDGIDLPEFASFTLLDSEPGRAALVRYFSGYAELAEKHGTGLVLETPTWRSNPDWGSKLGYSGERLDAANSDAVELCRSVTRPGTQTVVSGCVGPRGDGYVVADPMTPDEAARYHSQQIESFANANVDLTTAITMTYVAEATGFARAAQAAGVPAVVSFTVETDGRLPSGEALHEAVRQVDDATDGYPLYYALNCAHPTHFESVLSGDWTQRLGGLRANASTMSHSELDEAEELDAGDPADLARRYADLADAVPSLKVFGGCCGTDLRHVDAIGAALRARQTS